MKQHLTFVGTQFDKSAAGGIGEYKARFVCAKEGKESDAKDLARAFSAAAARNILRVRGHVVTMNARQIGARIQQIKSLLEHVATRRELTRGLKAVQTAQKVRTALEGGGVVVSSPMRRSMIQGSMGVSPWIRAADLIADALLDPRGGETAR